MIELAHAMRAIDQWLDQHGLVGKGEKGVRIVLEFSDDVRACAAEAAIKRDMEPMLDYPTKQPIRAVTTLCGMELLIRSRSLTCKGSE